MNLLMINLLRECSYFIAMIEIAKEPMVLDDDLRYKVYKIFIK